ncbi:ABC transporter substrate-binding protein [Nocardia jinanensis]|uniref:ABC transporter substrate-binding protein n=1 Tax=Nocardia jinanensis TaxID=382504 RepID=A0A917R4M8_9NOCA|nr:ABC transporter substrate-binding protein [Nocardia jinanensis]GGK90493.1 ABC transporter substrate-binding protein [Nocardia jinanensis]
MSNPLPRGTHRVLPGVALLTAALLTACSGPPQAATSAAAGFPMTVSSCGRDVTFDHAPQRVVTVGSVAAPLIAAAGAADRIVTRTFESAPFPGEYADELAGIETTSRTGEIAREEIIDRGPDVVVSFEGAAVTADDLAQVNIPLLVSRGYCRDAAGSFDDIFADIELYGRLFGTSAAANTEITSLRQRVDEVAGRNKAHTPLRAAALIISRDGAKISAYGRTSTVSSQMRILGLDNAFGDSDIRYSEINTETLIDRDPDIIVLLTQGEQTPESVRQALRERPELARLRAIRDNRMIVVPFGYTGPGPVAVEGIEVLDRELGALR